MQGTFRLMATEWMRAVTYLNRDLNLIELGLELRRDETSTVPEELEDLLKKLVALRRRFSKYETLILQQQSFCAVQACRGWTRSINAQEQSTAVANVTAAVRDFQQVIDMVNTNTERGGQMVTLIASLLAITQARLGLREAEQAAAGNRMVMLLTFAATFFLPINAVAAVLNMSGDFAPGGSSFPLFWLISVPLSAGLVLLLLLIMFWTKTWSLLSTMRSIRFK